MLYLTEENVSPASRTTGVSQVTSCLKLRGNAIVFTSIKLEFTNWHVLQRRWTLEMKAGPRGKECDVFGAALGSNLRQEAAEHLCGPLHVNVGPYFNHSSIAASHVLLKTPFACHPTQYVIMRASLDEP